MTRGKIRKKKNGNRQTSTWKRMGGSLWPSFTLTRSFGRFYLSEQCESLQRRSMTITELTWIFHKPRKWKRLSPRKCMSIVAASVFFSIFTDSVSFHRRHFWLHNSSGKISLPFSEYFVNEYLNSFDDHNVALSVVWARQKIWIISKRWEFCTIRKKIKENEENMRKYHKFLFKHVCVFHEKSFFVRIKKMKALEH